MGERARRDGIDVLVDLLEVEAEIDKKYPTETEAQRVTRFMQNVFEWADEVFNRVIEARGLVSQAKDLSGRRGPVDFDSPEDRLQLKQKLAPSDMRHLWNQFDHHTALHNAKPDKYPAVPDELKKLVDKLEHIWGACRLQGGPMESMGSLQWIFRFLQDDIPKMKDLYEEWKQDWNSTAEPFEVSKESGNGA